MEWFSDVPQWFWIAWTFIYGAAIGRFLNVCIYRIPKGIDVVRTPSHCPHCEERIPWYHNIPIVSWLVLRGRSSCCGQPIGLRYPLVELASASITAWLFAVHGLSIEFLSAWLLTCILLILIVIDWRELRLPNVLTIPGFALGVAFAAFGVRLDIVDALIGAAVGAGSLLAVAWYFRLRRGIEGMGMGDVKLMAMVGAFLGWRATIMVIILGSLLGIVYFVIFAARSSEGTDTKLPFGTFLGTVSIVMLLWGDTLLGAYGAMVHSLSNWLATLLG